MKNWYLRIIVLYCVSAGLVFGAASPITVTKTQQTFLITNVNSIRSQALQPLALGTGTSGTALSIASATNAASFTATVAPQVTVTNATAGQNAQVTLTNNQSGQFSFLRMSNSGGTAASYDMAVAGSAAGTNPGGFYIYDSVAGIIALAVAPTTAAVSLASTTASTNTTSGALKVAGGAGFGGSVFAGGNITTTGNFIQTGTNLKLMADNTDPASVAYMRSGGPDLVIASQGNAINLGSTSAGTFTSYLRVAGNSVGVKQTTTIFSVDGTTASTSTATGAVTVAGGVGVAGTTATAGLILGVTTDADGHTMAVSETTVVYTGTGGHTFTFLAASTNSGRVWFVKNRGSGSVTCDATALGNFFTTSSVATVTLNTGDAMMFQSDGTTWNVQ